MSDMVRVSPGNKCPICNHDTWCLLGHSVVICMRTNSNRYMEFKGGEVGYIHPHPDPKKKRTFSPKATRKPPQINARRLLLHWRKAYEAEQSRLPIIATELGVSVTALNLLECQAAGGWERAWAFPMKDGFQNYIGIRIRNEWGKKWAVTGSQAGIFIPRTMVRPRMFVVEGPTDTAAGVDMGLFVVGRPSCSGGVTHVCNFARNMRVKDVVLIADNDEPGIRGAKDLQRWLKVPSCVLTLPCKDLREFIKIGDRSTLDSMVDQLAWTQPTEQ